MEDGEGRHIDFRNTTILLTSNAGSELIAHLCEDPALVPGMPALREALQPALRQVFPAAFLGRLTLVPYLPLGEEALGRIVSLHLARVADRLQAQHGIDLRCSLALAKHIGDSCGTHETGARRLIAFIEQRLLPALSRHWLEALQDKRTISRISVDVGSAGADHELQGGDAIACHLEYA